MNFDAEIFQFEDHRGLRTGRLKDRTIKGSSGNCLPFIGKDGK